MSGWTVMLSFTSCPLSGRWSGDKVLLDSLGENDQITRARHVCQVKQVDSSACPHVKCGQFTLSYSQIHIHLKNRLISCTKYINDNFDKKYNFDSYFTIFYIVEFCFTIFDQDSNRDNPRDIWFDLTWQLRVTLDCIRNSHDVFYMRSSPSKQFWQYPCLVHGISPLFWREHLDPWWARSKLGGGKFLPNVAPSRQNIFAQQRSSPNWNPSFASLCAVGAQKSWQAYKLQTALRALGWVASSCCGTGHTSLQWIGCISMCTLHVAQLCCLSRIVLELF